MFDPSDVAIARYNPDGSLDASFDGDGKFARDLGSDDYATGVALRGDGDLVVNANSHAVTQNGARWALLRINANGSLGGGGHRPGAVRPPDRVARCGASGYWSVSR